jgi:Ser/Thr protein kinase RdoA (MazF antagonist)
VERYVHEPLEVLTKGGVISAALAGRYRDVASRIAEAVAKPLARARPQRIHGDLHWGNVIWAADGPILLDFDDFVVGPPVQDLWLLSRGGSEEARRGREQLLAGYELFREFDRGTLGLAEPLRALRIIYMSAWIARRWDDPSFRTGFPAFGTDNYWAAEYEEIFQIFESLRDTPGL